MMWAFDMPSDWEYIDGIVKKFDEVYCVELIASQKTRLERNKTENRLFHKASKRDIAASNNRLMNEDKYRLISNDGEIPFKNYIRINNEDISAEEVALMIKETFKL